MKLDPTKTAVLTLDFQQGIISMVTGSETAVATAAKAAEFAREKQYKMIHIGLGFSEGYPEVPTKHSRMIRLKENNLFLFGSPSAEFHKSVVHPSEQIIYKQRMSSFSENTLNLTLRARGIENLILFGLSTSGATLSTLRRAGDLDYQCFVIKDACHDIDPEVHRVLTEKIFPMHATVLTLDDFIKTQE